MKPITSELRTRIKINIKNKIPIDGLIENVDIKGEDLSWAIIPKLKRIDCNISGCNFSHAILGNDTNIFTLIRTNISNCNFEDTKFIGKVWMRSCNATNCNFKGADVSSVSYEHTDFSYSNFCGCIIRLDSRTNVGCKFDRTLVEELVKNWLNSKDILKNE